VTARGRARNSVPGRARTRPPLLDSLHPIIGRCTLSNIVGGAFQAAHLGFSLDRGAVGAGLMSEALVAVIRYAFEDLRLHRVMANYLPANVRSGRVSPSRGEARHAAPAPRQEVGADRIPPEPKVS